MDRSKIIDAFERCFCEEHEHCPGCYQDGPGFGIECRNALCMDVLTLLKEQKQGKWIVLDNCSNAGIYCSECNNKIFDYPSKPKKKLSNYCPNCGSKNEQFYNPSTGKYMNGI